MKKKFAVLVLALTMIFSMSSCGLEEIAGIGDYLQMLKGSLIGNDYNIQEFDNFGNLVFTAHGDKVSMQAETDNEGEPTSYIDITIDGYD